MFVSCCLGSCTSLSFEPSTRHCMFSLRPSKKFPQTRHLVKLLYIIYDLTNKTFTKALNSVYNNPLQSPALWSILSKKYFLMYNRKNLQLIIIFVALFSEGLSVTRERHRSVDSSSSSRKGSRYGG